MRVILIIVFISLGKLFSQQQANNWYFGSNAGITFNNGTPEALTNGSISYTQDQGHNEGTTSISDKDGNLLFYSNGMTVWNKQHNIMLNGDSLRGNFSSTQSSIIVPQPGSDKYFYVFTVGSPFCCGGDISDGFRYSIIDNCLDSMRGGIIPSQKNIKLTDTVAEKLAVTRHANGTDYWVLVHKYGSDKFIAFQLGAGGITNTVVSSAGSVYGGSFRGAQGQMKFSPNGKKVAVGATNGLDLLEVFDFNNATGSLFNATALVKPAGNQASIYGVEFSPDGSKLYASGITAMGDMYSFLVQYNLNDANLPMTEIYKYTTGNISGTGLQLGPDGKIYFVSTVNMKTLGCINNPNAAGTNCNLQESKIQLAGNMGSYTLPTFIAGFAYGNTKPAFCQCQTALVNLGADTTLCEGQNVSWKLKQTNATYAWQDGSSKTEFTASKAGLYYVTAFTNYCAWADTIKVTYNALPKINLGNDTSFCSGNSINLNATTSNASYVWDNGSATAQRSVSQQGIYSVTVTVNNCTASDVIAIETINCETVLEMPNVFTPNNDGTNDIYKPVKMNNISLAKLSIFNRWGQPVFETTDLATGWDGNTNNTQTENGTYVWVLEYTTASGANETKKGTLTLLR